MTALTSSPTTRVHAPATTTAPAPAEARGLGRDGIRLLVGTPEGVTHARFRDLPSHLSAGDVLVVNNSATVAGELDAESDRVGPVVVHCATRLTEQEWVVEVRTAPTADRAVLDAEPGERLVLTGGTELTLVEGYPREGSSPTGRGTRLWRARHTGGRGVTQAQLRHGRPIAYGYLDRGYPLSDYQTTFALVPGSAEMPSAARPFTPELVARLVAGGVGFATVTLHTGVSSQEVGEAPQPEWFEVGQHVADQVNAAVAGGHRVVAVGTTATRAIESATGADGRVGAAHGWTERVVGPDDPARVVTGLVTGWHDPQASHLLLVESVAGRALTQTAYDEAAGHGYLWHEFGDAALLLP